MWAMSSGIEPSALPTHGDVTFTGMAVCSGIHRDSKPNSSHFRARVTTSIVLWVMDREIPIFMLNPAGIV